MGKDNRLSFPERVNVSGRNAKLTSWISVDISADDRTGLCAIQCQLPASQRDACLHAINCPVSQCSVYFVTNR
jgi:hypothetical protein